MFINYLKMALRIIYRAKLISSINIIGLAIGIGCSILIMIYVLDELSVDQFHKNIDDIYQVNLKSVQNGVTGYQTNVAPSIAGTLHNNYPDVVNVVRTGNLGKVVLKTNDKMIVEENGIAADSSIFRIFTFPLLKGNISTVLLEPHSIVLTESTANKYFGEDEAIGKIIRIDNKFDMLVTGVMNDLPNNSSQIFDFIVPFSFLKDMGYEIEGSPFFPCSYSTFAVLNKDVSYKLLNNKIEKTIFFNANNISFSICLLPFKDAYLRTTNGIAKYTILSLIAFLILILACINFTNLATARSIMRQKEIGIRKVAGAGKFQLSKQLFLESILLVIISTVVSLLFTSEFLVLLNNITGKSLSIPFSNPVFILIIIGLIIISSFFAGIYPAIYLPMFKPVDMFRKQTLNKGKSILRKALIMLQFSLSIAFVICTFVMSRQIDFIRNFDMGFNQYNIVYVNLEGDIRQKYDLLKTEILKNQDILNVASSSHLPNSITMNTYTNWGRKDNIDRKLYTTDADYEYIKTFKLQMSAGRFYSIDFPGDVKNSIVVNEAAVRTLGMKDPIGNHFFSRIRIIL
jgi:putative ABC transport system permease protein